MNELIYIADDEPNICELIQSFLINAGYRTVCFSDGNSVLEAFEKQAPDLLVLDIMMPGLSGLELCAHIRKKSAAPIIIVSAKDAPLDRIEGIALGGDDYLVKPFLPLELVARVRALFRRIELTRGVAQTTETLSFCDVTLNPKLRTAALNGEQLLITPTEFDFLVYMMHNSDRAVSREELLATLWEYGSQIPDTRAADDLVKRLRKKLAAQGSRLKIEAVWGYGFRLGAGEGRP